MLYEFRQVHASGSITSYIVQNPRIENGMNVAEIVGTFVGFSTERRGEWDYEVCQPKKIIIGGDFTMVEFTRELISGNAHTR